MAAQKTPRLPPHQAPNAVKNNSPAFFRPRLTHFDLAIILMRRHQPHSGQLRWKKTENDNKKSKTAAGNP
jgi:hypothetical protein